MKADQYHFKMQSPEKKYLIWMHRLLLLAGSLLLILATTTNWFSGNRPLFIGLIIVLLFILTFLYKQATADYTIHIGEKIVLQKGVFKKTYSWSALQQVVIKDGLLTIDLKSNKLIQQLTEPNPTIVEADFNSFCQNRL